MEPFTRDEIEQRILEILPSGAPTEYPYDWLGGIVVLAMFVGIPLLSWLWYRRRP